MEELIKIIVEYVSIWAPALVSISGTVAVIISCYNKFRTALDGLKADKTLKEVNDKLDKVAHENEELVKCNKLLLDQITKIKDYADHKKEG